MGGMKEILYPLNWSATQLSLHAILNSASCREGIILGWVRWETGKSLGRKEYHSCIDKCSLLTGDQGFSRRKTAPGIHTSLQFSGIKLRTSGLSGVGRRALHHSPILLLLPLPMYLIFSRNRKFCPTNGSNWNVSVSPPCRKSAAEGDSVLWVSAQTARTFCGSKGRNRVRMGLSKNSLNISPPTVTSKPRTVTRKKGLCRPQLLVFLYHRRSSR